MIFDEIYETENLEEAWKRVRAAKSPAGIDRISVADFEKNISANLHTLQKQIREEQYKPQPVTVFQTGTGSRKTRPIGISTVRDKIVQQAILRVLSPRFECHFLPCSFAYRPKKSALAAVEAAGKQIKAGKLWVLQMDVEKFFDTMDHGILLDLLGRVIKEKPLIRLVSRLLKARIFKEMGLFDNLAGSQQGSGLSPLLSNIYLHPMDLLLWKRYGENYLRYSDDITLFAEDQESCEAAAKLAEKCLKELKLAVNPAKTSIAHVSSGIVYLGYHMDTAGRGPDKKSAEQLELRMQAYEKIRKNDPVSPPLEELKLMIRGWHSYYKSLKPVKPVNILSAIALAELAGELGENATAREVVKQSRNFVYTHPEICFRMGCLYEQMGMASQAMREFARALESDPDMAAAKEKIRSLQEGDEDVYQSIEKIQLVLHHNPGYREGYVRLAEHYTRLHLFGFAEKAAQKALEIDSENSIEPPPAIPGPEEQGFDFHCVDQDLFMKLFAGRQEAHARQWVDERGRWGFMRVDRPLKKKDVYAHLKGECTLGIYPVTQTDTVWFIVFDVDTVKRKILEAGNDDPESFRKMAHQDIVRIKTVCESMNLHLYIEDSGYKGRHGWLFFSRPFPASAALELGEMIMNAAGDPSEHMMWELFPMGKSDRHKSIIKLPLGINRKNSRRCLFLTDADIPVPDQGLFLKTLEKNDTDTIKQMLVQEKKGKKPESNLPELHLSPALDKMFKGCAVLSHLVQKAGDTNYLTHYERIVLLYTLSFAGQEGTDFLHKVIGYCINYNRHTTQRFVERRKDSPISCAKIGEYFPELVKEKGCACKFALPRGTYPSPVMYLLESELEQADPEGKRMAEKEHAKPQEKTGEKNREDVMAEDAEKILDFGHLFSDEDPEPDPEPDASDPDAVIDVSGLSPEKPPAAEKFSVLPEKRPVPQKSSEKPAVFPEKTGEFLKSPLERGRGVFHDPEEIAPAEFGPETSWNFGAFGNFDEIAEEETDTGSEPSISGPETQVSLLSETEESSEADKVQSPDLHQLAMKYAELKFRQHQLSKELEQIEAELFRRMTKGMVNG